MKPVSSSLINQVYYDRRNKILHILFHGNAYYIYYEVSYYRYRKLMQADSKGRYFNKYIKNKYKYRRVK